MESGLEQFKQRTRATWAAGDFDVIAKNIRSIGPRLVQAVGVEPGMKVLDVGCGTGNVAIPAAVAGADVTGVDLTPELFDAARRHAEEAGVDISWVEGDAEALPFADGSFDRVFSSFGAIFAPRHEVAAAEMARVLAPGGAIAMTAWTPEGLNGQLFMLMGSRLPPPPPFAQPPFLWGTADHVHELFDPHGLTVDVERTEVVFERESLAALFQEMEEYLGPLQMAKTALGDDEWTALRGDLLALHERFNRATDGGAQIVAEYLLIVARKPR